MLQNHLNSSQAPCAAIHRARAAAPSFNPRPQRRQRGGRVTDSSPKIEQRPSTIPPSWTVPPRDFRSMPYFIWIPSGVLSLRSTARAAMAPRAGQPILCMVRISLSSRQSDVTPPSVVRHDIRPCPCAGCIREAAGFRGHAQWLVGHALRAATIPRQGHRPDTGHVPNRHACGRRAPPSRASGRAPATSAPAASGRGSRATGAPGPARTGP